MAGNVDEQDSEQGRKSSRNSPEPEPRDTSKEQPHQNGYVVMVDNTIPEEKVPLDEENMTKTVLNGMLPNGKIEVFLMEEATDKKTPLNVDNNQNNGVSLWQAYATLLILLIANTLNYMDRYTIAGVLTDIQKYYGINNSEAGLLQTAFICSYMVFSPIFGYLGDRFNRKLIMAIGIGVWSVLTLCGSFVGPKYFYVFLMIRGLVGVGEASYSTIAPTIIADLFVKEMRTMALAVFYFAIPVGSGLGYIVGSNVAHALGAWQWALRVTPGLGVLCVLCILCIVREPTRGASEGGTHLSQTTWLQDLKYLGKNKSFVLSTAGFTCVAFVAGALSLWAPTYMQYSIRVQGDYMSESQVSLIFGVITCVAGLVGVGAGSFSAGQLRRRYKRADPLVCAFGLIMCAPFIFFAFYMSKFHTAVTWVLIFVGETFLCLNWAIVTDIVLYIVIPTRRSTAEAFQILISHALGDAGSPYLVGAVSDHLHASYAHRGEVAAKFISLQYSLYMCAFVSVIGGGFFLATALFIESDKAKADKAIKGALGTAAEREQMLNGQVSSPADSDVRGPVLA